MENLPPVKAAPTPATHESGHAQAESGLKMSPPVFQLQASPALQTAAGSQVAQRSSLSEKLAKIYKEQGRDAYFVELRKIKVCDQDVSDWIMANLIGDDQWLALKIADYGDESTWPIHLKVEREMRPFPGCTGIEGVKTLLRQAAGAEAKNTSLTASIDKITRTQSIERWLLRKLQELGTEANFTWKDKIIQWYLQKGELTAINEINARGLSIVTFEKAFDKWKMKKDNSIVVDDISSRLRGNSEGITIRINAALTVEQAVATLYHEVQHQVVDSQNLPYLDEEIEVRVRTEEMMIKTGLPETKPGYRKQDGTVDRAFIDKEIRSSNHYNPTDKERVGRWYEGENRTGQWTLP